MVEKDIHVIMACRNVEKAEAVKKQITQETGKSGLEVMELNTASLASVRKFAANFLQKYQYLDILVLNAGIISGKEVKLSEDNIEMTWATNHFGHFLLTNLLLEILKKTGKSRIVVVSSTMHDYSKAHGKSSPLKFTLQEINDSNNYEATPYYRNTKLANVMFTYILARKLKDTGVTVNAVCPGFIPVTNCKKRIKIQY
jgi:NAD(P)-dependent dehydrogenase (short-subunit alcohol dehydrogenase family)